MRYYRRVTSQRREEPALVYGDCRPQREEHPQAYAYLRALVAARIFVL